LQSKEKKEEKITQRSDQRAEIQRRDQVATSALGISGEKRETKRDFSLRSK